MINRVKAVFDDFVLHFKRTLSGMSLAIIGQAFNFLAMLLPVFAGRADMIAFLIFPLAVAYILARFSSLAFHVQYLTQRTDSEKSICFKASTLSLVFISGLILAVAVIAWVLLNEMALQMLSIGLLTFSQGLYFIYSTILIRENALTEFAAMRFFFGVVNCLTTVAACYGYRSLFALVAATAFTNFSSAVFVIGIGSKKGHLPKFRGKTVGYVTRAFPAMMGVLLADVSSQIQSLLVPFMGPYKEFWAAMQRLGGGLGTVAQQILAPPLEARLSRIVTSGLDDQLGRSFVKKSIAMGICFSGFGTFSVLVCVYLAAGFAGNIPLLVIMGIVVSIFVMVTGAVTVRMPYILGRAKYMQMWGLLRTVSFAVLLLLPSDYLLIMFGVVSAVFWAFELRILLGRKGGEKIS